MPSLAVLFTELLTFIIFLDKKGENESGVPAIQTEALHLQ